MIVSLNDYMLMLLVKKALKGFETKELFKSCRLDDYKEEDNERSKK